MLCNKIVSAVPSVTANRPINGSFEISLGQAQLHVQYEDGYIHQDGEFKQSGWDVVASGAVGVVQRNPSYNWWSSLWFTNLGLDGSNYRWYEVAFYDSPLLGSRRQFEPFHLTNDSSQADAAIAPRMGKIEVAYGPKPVDGESLTDFCERWRPAEASFANLRRVILRMGFKPLQDVANLGQKVTRTGGDAVRGTC